MSPEEERLAASVAGAYEAFAAYRLQGPLRVCHCPCCMTYAAAQELASTPLRQIPSPLLAEYTNSAHGYDEEFTGRELRTFLPRYLELIAADDPPDFLGPHVVLRRLIHADWRERWPEPERAALEEFFEALLLARLSRLEPVRTRIGWRAAEGAGEALTLAITAGAALEPLLAAWEDAPDPGAALHAAGLRLRCDWSSGEPFWREAFLSDRPEAAAAVGAWLARPEMTERIESAFFAAEDPRLAEALSAGA